MKKGMTRTLTGLAVGMAAGTAAWMMSDRGLLSSRRAKRLKKSAGRALTSAGAVIDELTGMMH